MRSDLRLWLLGLASGLLILGSSGSLALSAELEFEVLSATVVGGGATSLDLQITSDQGFTAASMSIGIDPTLLEVTNVATLVAAEFFSAEILPTGGVNVRMEAPVGSPWAATDEPFVRVSVASLTAPALAIVTPVEWAEGEFGSPPVFNTLTMDGQVAGTPEGLVLLDGAITVLPPPTNRLAIDSASAVQGDQVRVPILVSNPAGPLEGFAIAVAHDVAGLDLQSISLDDTVTAAVGPEFVDAQIEPFGSGGTLVVVFDFSPPFFGQTLPVGVDQVVAYFEYQAHAGTLAPDDIAEFDLTFVDGTLGSPPFDNGLIVAGMPGVLVPDLVSGAVTVLGEAPPVVTFWCGPRDLVLDGAGDPISEPIQGLRGGETEICFFYQSTENVQGFQLAACFDCDLVLSNFSTEGSIVEAVGAEFINWQIDNDPYDGDGCEFVVGILLDALPPFEAQTVPPTVQPLLIGCVTAGIPEAPACARDLDDARGKAVKFIVAGPDFELGPGGEIEVDPFLSVPGETLEVCFYYTSPFDIQGFQLSISLGCGLDVGAFSIEGSMPEIAGAEFVNFSFDNDPDDGDGCELVGGILLDLFPPFDGQTVPATDVPLLIGCVPVTVPLDAPCESIYPIEFINFLNGGEETYVENIAVVNFGSYQDIGLFCSYILVEGPEPCDKLSIDFCDYVDGTGGVLIENIAVIDFESIQDIEKMGCDICLIPVRRFLRGDCNIDEKVDLADAATVIGWEFSGIEVTCRDACDANDDGLINLADSVLILHYVFESGGGPPFPFPDCGFDPTEDELACDLYDRCD